MDLSPEEKQIGKENFCAAIGSPLVRRDFLQKGINQGISSGSGLGPYYFGYEKSIGEPIRVGFLGTGDEGNVLINAINPDFIDVAAIADIRPYNVHRAFHGDHESDNTLKVRCGLMKKYGWETEEEARKHVNVYGDYRELLENEKDLDAVIIALPLHLHAPAAIAAMKLGKHVLTEKLMAHSVHECKQMARVASQMNVHLATGHQRHYSILYDNAVHLIRTGLLGDLHYIRAQWHRGNLPGKDSWQQPMPRDAKPDDKLAGELEDELGAWRDKLEKLEEELDKLRNAAKPDERKTASKRREVEAWRAKVAQKKAQLADAKIKDEVKKYDYRDALIGGEYDRPAIEELIRWRLWNRTGGGLMAELGSHQLDAASIFIAAMFEGKKQYPLSVTAVSNRPLFPLDREVDDHVYCLFEFPTPEYDPNDDYRRRKTISVAYASINGNGFGGYGETVLGTEGTLVLEREADALLYRTSATTGKIKVASGPKLELDEKGDPVSAAIGVQALAEAERGYTEQLEHWAWCIRRNPNNSDPEIQPRCHPKVAIADAVIALVTNIAAQEGRRIALDPRWFDPDSDETPEGVKPGVGEYA
jgi:predicted dehydrogenase